ncbi:MAG TPA: molybdate ABC transporter permease subunit [Terriglobales bacterium]|nr:molybdate ABC transporter permease subunit [Terriglobales bacterium]
MNWEAILLTIKLATLVALILLAIGLPLALWITFSRFRFKYLVEAVIALPLVLPPTVLGFYVLLAIGSRSPVGALFEKVFGHSFAFSFEGLLVASVLYSMPFAVQPFAAAFSSIDVRLLQASSLLGASRWRTFFKIIVPLSLPGLVTGVVVSFAHTVGEFGVVLMVGGNIPGVTRTVSVDIYDRVQQLDHAGAKQTALLLLIFSFTVLSVVYASNRRLWRMWFAR